MADGRADAAVRYGGGLFLQFRCGFCGGVRQFVARDVAVAWDPLNCEREFSVFDVTTKWVQVRVESQKGSQ